MIEIVQKIQGEGIVPHHPEQRRDPEDGSCSACHVAVPEEGVAAADARLRDVEGGVCATCHQPDPHLGAHSHLHEALGDQLLASLPPQVAPSAVGTVQCFSCHEVHDLTPPPGRRPDPQQPLATALRQQVREEWAVEGQVAWPGEDEDPEHSPMLSLSIEDGSLCRACHGVGGP